MTTLVVGGLNISLSAGVVITPLPFLVFASPPRFVWVVVTPLSLVCDEPLSQVTWPFAFRVHAAKAGDVKSDNAIAQLMIQIKAARGVTVLVY